MIYIIAAILGVAVGMLFKGKLSNLLNFRIRKLWLLITAFFIQSASQVLALKGFELSVRYSLEINILVFGILFIVLWFNRKYIGILSIGAGCLLNAIAMTANGGKMPVSEGLLQKYHMQGIIEIYRAGGDGKHVLTGGTTRLGFLGDIICMPDYFGNIAKFVSIGDIFVVLGLFIFIAEIVKGTKAKEKQAVG